MKYTSELSSGRWIKRYKRFFLDVETNQGPLTVHCPNTGSMKNCGDPGDLVWYSLSDNPKRKLPGTAEVIEQADGHKIGINTHRANKLVAEALTQGLVSELNEYGNWRSEVKVGNSRLDFCGTSEDGAVCFVEVKSLTLHEGDGLGCFPDAVTERGQKHLKELMELVNQGVSAALLFCVQHSAITEARPADHIDPVYGRLLREAVQAGVKVLAYKVDFKTDSSELVSPVPVVLS
ncbi:DNA/RNA nuclease SfsA [Litoribacillus peritrichatus]